MTATATEYTVITCDTADGVHTITMNRPDVLNAFNGPLLSELTSALKAAETTSTRW